MTARRSTLRLTRRQVQSRLGVTEDYLITLEHEQLVECDEEGRYEESQVERVRLCRTLREELGVNAEGVEVILRLLERMQAERRQFREVLDWLRRNFRVHT